MAHPFHYTKLVPLSRPSKPPHQENNSLSIHTNKLFLPAKYPLQLIKHQNIEPLSYVKTSGLVLIYPMNIMYPHMQLSSRQK
jgi:hypothetical protein